MYVTWLVNVPYTYKFIMDSNGDLMKVYWYN